MARQLQTNLTTKQYEAWQYLTDEITRELVFGGGAGGGKTYLGCVWVATTCLQYPGIRAVIAREVLKHLKQSTLLTLLAVLSAWGLKADHENGYTYNKNDGTITFNQTGSVIYLKELRHKPSDPNWDRIASTEYTLAFIDETQQIRKKAKNILMSRIRFKLDEYGLMPKLLMTCNPGKNFLYKDFYKPWKDKELEGKKAFLPSLVTDNPNISEHYIDTLKDLSKPQRKRLLEGDWEYDDDPNLLVTFDQINDLFTNTVDDGDRSMIIDVARRGEDKTVIYIFNGYCVEHIFVYDKTGIDEVENIARKKAEKFKIPFSRIVIDEDGVGGGVVDNMPGVKGHVSNARPLEENGERPNYQNLRAQCMFKLARAINRAEIAIECDDPDIVEDITEELGFLKEKDADKDKKLKIISKEEIKEDLGRSPDHLDTLSMRFMLDMEPEPNISFI